MESESAPSEKLGLTLKRPELNILILGETGVGKSTWINAFYTFLSYSSLQEAEQGDLKSIIPTSFTILNEDLEIVRVTTGQDDNEVFETGQSSTQGTKIHRLQISDTSIVQLIDTPGIGDTRGLEQDQLNFKNIMETVKGLGELHGICILLKPNNARLTLMLRFCILELIRHLDKSASKNIVFGFTNSRETFFRPGDTLPALRSLFQENNDSDIQISQDTVYCFDSEAFRYLASIKNDPPLTFTEEQRKDFGRSWEKSLSETRRMLEYIQTLQPHLVKSTVDFTNIRDSVLEMSRPIAEALIKLQLEKAVIRKELEIQSELEKEIGELKKRQITTVVEYQRVQLERKRLVCSKCLNDKAPGEDETTSGYYKVCHSNCSVGRVPRERMGVFQLYFCDFIDFFGRCRRCKHSFRSHFHVFHESKSGSRQVEDLNVKEMLRKKMAEKENDEEMNRKEKILEEYSSKQKELMMKAVKLEYFVRQNSILTQYHDRMEQELRHLMKEHQDQEKVENVGALEDENVIRIYNEQKEAFEAGIADGEYIVTSVETEHILNELGSLKELKPEITE